MLPKAHRLPPSLVRTVLATGRSLKGTSLTLKYKESKQPFSRCAIIPSSKYHKRAVDRTLTKRHLRQLVSKHLSEIHQSLDFVLISYAKVTPSNKEVLASELLSLLKKTIRS